MFQNFNVLKVASYKKRLLNLRTAIIEHELDGFLIPRSDLYQNEYIEPADSRLQWMTGFTGSAGLCLVTLESALIFVDGRYKIQATEETDKELFKIVHSSEISFKEWFKKNCKNKIIGYDPWLHTVSEIFNLRNDLDSQTELKGCSNLIDLVWTNKPGRKHQIIKSHPHRFSGTSSVQKRKLVSKVLEANKADVAILTKPDSICWLLNIRGNDIIHTPIVQALAIIDAQSKVKLFLRNEPISKSLISFLGANVEIIEQALFPQFICSLKHQNVQIDPISCPMNIYHYLESQKKEIIQYPDPCGQLKAIKNETEIRGAKAAHLIDASAFVKFLHWLDTKSNIDQQDEITVTKQLETFRNCSNQLKEIAFDTICGTGSNGAIVHYKVTEKTNRRIENNNLLLVDSGGQYRMGTTDLTRTIAIGTPNKKMVDIFTHVLKGMIAISDLNWPAGLSGQHIDSLARASLWSIGLDYDHGTGHGIGSYLSVHEGPHGISKNNKVPLEPGMLVSNEPGYYETGKFGIRIENILLIKKLPKIKQTEPQMLAFETLTLVPIDKRLINIKILTDMEKCWVNNYHRMVYEKVAPTIPLETQYWLKKSCAPL